MVEQFENEGTEAWRLQNLHQLGNHAIVVDRIPNLRIKREIKKQAQGNLKQQLVVAGYEPVKFIDNVALLHLDLVLAEDTQLFEEIEDDEQKVRIVPIEHRDEL